VQINGCKFVSAWPNVPLSLVLPGANGKQSFPLFFLLSGQNRSALGPPMVIGTSIVYQRCVCTVILMPLLMGHNTRTRLTALTGAAAVRYAFKCAKRSTVKIGGPLVIARKCCCHASTAGEEDG